MQAAPAGSSTSDLKRMRGLVRTFFEERTYNKILKYKIHYALLQKQRKALTAFWLVCAILAAGAAIVYGILEPSLWLLLAVAIPAGLLQILRFFPRAPQPPYPAFRECYDRLLAHDKEQLIQRACEGLRIGGLSKDNFPLWGIWGVFGEHRQGVSAEPDVLTDALCCEDGVLRCTPLSLTAFSFEDQHMHVFQGAADITIGNVIYSTVRDIAYSDIVGVSENKTTKEFRLAQLDGAVKAGLAECGLWGGLQHRAINGIIAADDNDFFEIALTNGEKVHAVFRDVDLMSAEAFEYRYGECAAACEIPDEAFRPGGVPSRRDFLRDLANRIEAKKAEAAVRKPAQV